MKKFLFLGMSLFFGLSVAIAQQVKNKQLNNTTPPPGRTCGVMDHESYLQQQDPAREAERQAFEQLTQNYATAQKNANPNSPQVVITIPVVVHVIWNTAAENISDNQVFSQIQVLNLDYSLTNTDAGSIPAPWTSIAGNFGIQFCLAQQTPTGAATTGIERRNISSNVSFSTNDAAKHFSSNGLDAWDPTRYLNLWVCNLGSGLLGYAEFPTTSVSQTYGVVILYNSFGSNYTSYGTFADISGAYDHGRTLTHELGHCFNLFHIWGDDNGACSGSDQCADTPNQANMNYGCPTYPHTDACTASNPGVMFMNYMDYTDDACMYMFTNNQKTRALAVLNSTPYNALQTSNGCQSPSSNTLDAGISAINSPTGTICASSFIPSVTLKNFGTTTMTTCTIKYRVDALTLQTYSWSGSLATNATATVTLPSMTATAGTHTFTCYSLSPNGNADQNAANDQTTSTFTISSTGVSIPFFEGFEGATFVPTGWTLNNPDAGVTWDRTTTCFKTGVACARMDNFNYSAGNGQRDEMITKAVNISTVSSPVLTFQVAYTYWTVPYLYSDTLQVLVSTNCGATWTSVYQKYGATLATAPPLSSTTVAFIPTAAQWRLETVSLIPYQTATNLMVKFRSGSSYEDDLYLDDINIMNATDIAESNLASLIKLFPNPSTGIFNLSIALGVEKNLTVKITNTLGQTVQQFAEGNTIGGTYNFDLSAQPNGVYFVQVIAGEEKAVQRIIINR